MQDAGTILITILCWKCLKRWHCSRTFCWRTIQQLEERSTKNCRRLCCCYWEQRVDHAPLRRLTEIRLSESVTSCLFILTYLLSTNRVRVYGDSMILLLVTLKLLNWSQTTFYVFKSLVHSHGT